MLHKLWYNSFRANIAIFSKERRIIYKKTLSLILAILMCLPICACGNKSESAKEPVPYSLTTENIKDYLAFQTTVTECEVTETPVLMINTYSGNAKVRLNVVNRSDAKFDNVSITLKISTDVTCIPGPVAYGWEFKLENQQTGKEPHKDTNYRTVKIALPNDGNWEDSFDLELALYGSKYLLSPSELSSCSVEVVRVTGLVYQ
ncbi:MAG: hypothetical protein IJV82_03640 [Oscillospiraceae bacterium]|nr:hypothetical protein [Oscillospiraceae bacterium]